MNSITLKKQKISINNKNIAYAESGSGDPIIFLHGNPTSSYLWRNITPHLESQGRCICIDLIGMGDSDKLDNPDENSYQFEEHYHYVNAAIESLTNGENTTFVIHDWGSALGFNWCYHNPDSVKGIAYMEAIVKEMTWEDWRDEAKGIFQGFRSDAGESLVLEKNYFVERVLPGSILRRLRDEEIEEYRRPFLNPGEDRRPTLSWPREIPIEGQPGNVCEIVNRYAEWMETNNIPKLFINAEPGAITTGRIRDFCRSWRNQTEVTVKGGHFVQEDSPDEIGKAISTWYKNIP